MDTKQIKKEKVSFLHNYSHLSAKFHEFNRLCPMTSKITLSVSKDNANIQNSTSVVNTLSFFHLIVPQPFSLAFHNAHKKRSEISSAPFLSPKSYFLTIPPLAQGGQSTRLFFRPYPCSQSRYRSSDRRH